MPRTLTAKRCMTAFTRRSGAWQVPSPEEEDAIRSMCERPGVECLGLPSRGGSCLAFGLQVALRRPHDDHCHECRAPETVLTYWYILFGGVMALLVLYIFVVYAYARGERGVPSMHPKLEQPGKWCLARHQTSLKGWVAASTVAVLHYQTISLIGYIRPSWPHAVEGYLNCLALDYTCFTPRECVVDVTSELRRNLDAQAFANTILVVLLMVPLLAMFALTLPRLSAQVSRQREREDDEAAAASDELSEHVIDVADVDLTESDDAPPKRRRKAGGASRGTLLPIAELACSIFVVVLFGVALRAARQQVTWGSDSLGRAQAPLPFLGSAYGDVELVISGGVLLLFLALVWSMRGTASLFAQRARRWTLVHPSHASVDLMHLAYFTEPYRPSAAFWPLMLFLQHGTPRRYRSSWTQAIAAALSRTALRLPCWRHARGRRRLSRLLDGQQRRGFHPHRQSRRGAGVHRLEGHRAAHRGRCACGHVGAAVSLRGEHPRRIGRTLLLARASPLFSG